MNETSHERILRVATALFAKQGFDGVTTREVAKAAGLNIATVHHHFGRKSDLYEAAFERAHERERAFVMETLDRLSGRIGKETDETVEALVELTDAYLDFYLAEGPIARLWMHQWLGDAAQLEALDAKFTSTYAQKIGAQISSAIERGVVADVDVAVMFHVIIWVSHSFAVSGLVGSRTSRSKSDVARVRAFLRSLVERMFRPAPSDARGRAPSRKRARASSGTKSTKARAR